MELDVAECALGVDVAGVWGDLHCFGGGDFPGAWSLFFGLPLGETAAVKEDDGVGWRSVRGGADDGWDGCPLFGVFGVRFLGESREWQSEGEQRREYESAQPGVCCISFCVHARDTHWAPRLLHLRGDAVDCTDESTRSAADHAV